MDLGFHQPRRDRIETLGALPVAFLDLGAEIAGIGADVVAFEEAELTRIGFLPDFEGLFFLEDAHQHGRAGRGAHGLQGADGGAGKRLVMTVVTALDETGAGRQSQSQPEKDDQRAEAAEKGSGQSGSNPKSE